MAVYMTAVRIVAMSNPPALGEPELSARNLPGYDVCHPDPSQEHAARSTLLQLALFQVFFPYILVLDPLSSLSLLTFHSSGPPARISHMLPTNLIMTGPLTATDSRVNSLPEIPFSRFAQQSTIEYLWSIVETRSSLREKNRNQDDKVHQHPRDRGRGSKCDTCVIRT
jgi:hypothetical protein